MLSRSILILSAFIVFPCLGKAEPFDALSVVVPSFKDRPRIAITSVMFFSTREISVPSGSKAPSDYDHYFLPAVGTSESIGVAEVMYPTKRDAGDGDRPLIDVDGDNPLSGFSINNLTFLHTIGEFGGLLKGMFANNHRRPLLYVHGFNVSFTESIVNAARLRLDTNNPNIVAFTWPGDSPENLYSKYRKAETAEVDSFRELPTIIKIIDINSEALNVVAHSMGARLFFDALNASADSAMIERSKVGRIVANSVLAAPDIDLNKFLARSPSWAAYVGSTTILCNEDNVLYISSFINSASRLGSCSKHTQSLSGVRTQYVEGVTGLTKHGYFVDTKQALSIIRDLTQQ